MKIYKQQIHHLFNAAAILNPFIENKMVDVKAGNEYKEH